MKRLYLLFLLLSLMSTVAFAQRVALRTDLLLWGTTTPNAGVETSISRHFTMALNGAYNAWKFGNDMKLNLYLIQPELRYWPCRKFEGHFLGVHGHYAYYNVGQIPFFRVWKTLFTGATCTAEASLTVTIGCWATASR